MRIVNRTGLLFGPKVTSRHPPRPEVTLVVRGAFTLAPEAPLALADDQGSLRADVFQPDDDDRAGACLYPSDFADFKLNAEVMLEGTCHAPGKKRVTECPVRFSVGAWSKTLMVLGPRAWSDRRAGAVMSEPLGFEKLALGHAQAFGGPGFARNPVGKGFETDELPRVEHPLARIRSRADHPDPAAFGPVNPRWPQRAGKLGTRYGKEWREKRAPFYAEDFDWSYFSAAPPDQQLQGYLRGDEEISFHNLHPEATRFSTRLPGLRVRVFVKGTDGRVREPGMSIDTLFADLDAGLLYLTWRGVCEVGEIDLADVATILVAREALADPRAPADVYRAEIEAFEADPTGLGAAMPEGLLAWAEAREKREAGELPPEPPDLSLDPVSRGLKSSLGPLLPADALNAVQRAMAGVAASGGGLGAPTVGGGAPPAPLFAPLKPGAMPPLHLGATMRSVLQRADQVKKDAAARGQTVDDLGGLDAMVNDPRLAQLDPSYKPPRLDDPPPEEPGPGRSMEGADLSGRDLSGIDLSGANLQSAVLTRANLRGARLAGANLRYAVLYKADLTGADLTGADLTLAQVALARAAGAIFAGANLEQACFEKADLSGAVLERASGEYVQLMRANLTGAKARGASLVASSFEGAILTQADFTEALLSRCMFIEAHARGVRMTRATVVSTSFEKADLREASFALCKGEGSIWMHAKLDDADLQRAWMPRAFFIEATAARCVFVEANLREARFYRATLDGASFTRANLFGVDLRETRVAAATFAGANLYGAQLTGAAGKGCDFRGANVKTARMEGMG